MEATVVLWGYIGIVENIIETTIILWYIRVVEANCMPIWKRLVSLADLRLGILSPIAPLK